MMKRTIKYVQQNAGIMNVTHERFYRKSSKKYRKTNPVNTKSREDRKNLYCDATFIY